MTVADLCTAALQRLGIVPAGAAPASEDIAVALARLNALADSWRTQRLFTYALVRTTWTLVSGTGSYSVGTGGDVNIVRPVYVDHVTVLDTAQTPSAEYSLGPLLTDQEYERIVQKGLTAPLPSCAYYNATYPTGTITFYPIPSVGSLQGVLYAPNTSSVLALSDTLSVPPGYQLFYQESLAVNLAPDFERQPAPQIVASLTQAETYLKTANYRPIELRGDPALVPHMAGRWNLLTGAYNPR